MVETIQFDRRTRGRGGRRGRGRRARAHRSSETQWIPCTKLGRLVRAGKIKSLEEIYYHSLSVKEYQIIDYFLPSKIKDGPLNEELMKVMPVQKQTRAGQRTRFKSFVIVGDFNGHLGLGVKCAKEVASAIRGAIISAKLNIIPVRRGFWGSSLGSPHTVPVKVSGKCGSVTIRLIPAPRGTGIIAAKVPKKVIHFAGVIDVFTSTRGKTSTLGNFAKATFLALQKTYLFLTPDMWGHESFIPCPVKVHLDDVESKKSITSN